MCWLTGLVLAWAVVATVFAFGLARSIRIADQKEEGHRDV